ncbi:unnamed protein product [Choristocarpus tenellus]|uniref:30S ribosomal protein S3 n=1 Tax=Choristocarpus tenellus TaxID=116065 RepID=UPI002E7690EE|nr:30S ribosomal protein S3 [Choristocarpus tenellus]WAM62327.1 30S ribosomal protein S3 [Choristocarpus tenellus]
MGHKTHPLGFRLGILQTDKSTWYSNSNSYAKNIKEDYQIRQIIFQFLKANNIQNPGISKILIKRNEKNHFFIEILTIYPGLIVGKSGSILRELDQKLTLFLKTKKILINIIEIQFPYKEAVIVANALANKLEERVSVRKALREVINRYKIEKDLKNLKGIKVQIAGRLNGAEIARTEWVREGRVPLQTLRANIDYSYQTAKTIYGILGIKIWLFKNDVLVK